MTFGHDPFNGTHVPNLVHNAETASGTMVFNGMFDWVPGVGDDDDNGESWWEGLVPDTFKDKVSDRLKEIQKKAKKVYGKAKEGWAFLTGEDEAIELFTVNWCCPAGSRQTVVYGKYRVSDKKSVRGGPQTLNGVQWNVGDEYIAAFRSQANGVSYKEVGDGYNQTMNWNNIDGLGRMYSSLSGEKKRASFNAPPFGAPPRTVEETVDGVATGNTQQVPALTIQQLVDNFLEQSDGWRQGCTTEGIVEGCMNPVAENYNSNANCPDGSCKCGNDQAGNRKRFNSTGSKCVVVQCTDINREKHSDGSCKDKCNEGFSFKKGVFPKICVPTPVDCVVSSWSAWSECVDGMQTRTREITTQAAYGGKTCEEVQRTKIIAGSNEREPVIYTQSKNCASTTTTTTTTGRGIDPNNCDQANRVKNDDNTCGDCKTDYEENEDGECVEVAEPQTETQEGMPIGLIAGGVGVVGVLLYFASRA